MLLEKTDCSADVGNFSRFFVILGYCITDVGFGYKIADTFGYFSANGPSSRAELHMSSDRHLHACATIEIVCALSHLV